MPEFTFETDCINSTARWIGDMQDQAVGVSYSTLARRVGTEQIARVIHGYDWGSERGGLRMKDDYAVAYYRSIYRGRPCYFICWSAIEYVFTLS